LNTFTISVGQQRLIVFDKRLDAKSVSA